jgi:hypothetical protein
MMEIRDSRILQTISLLIAVCLLSSTVRAQYGGGTGEPNDPYLIYTPEQMNAIGAEPNDWDKHFKLMADIDLSGFSYDTALIAPDTNGATWGFDGPPFSGVFDGNGHIILHLTVKGGSNLGLFGRLDDGAEVKNLGLVAINITGSDDSNYVGGLVGYSQGNITNCHSTGTVSGDDYVGGLVGFINGNISTSYSSGTVSGGEDVGGLVGHSRGSIEASYSSGTVSGYRYVGGLVGINYYDFFEGSGSINTSYSSGTVSGYRSVGGLVGYNRGSITTSYSTGAVTGNMEVGGLVGAGSTFTNSVQNSVWDIETSGLYISAGGFGLTTSEMIDPYMLGLNGFGGDPNWVLDPGRDYPRLAWEGTAGQIIPELNIDPLEGHGTKEQPYRIDTAAQLILLGRASILCDKHLILGADIDLDSNLPDGQVFKQAVIPSFTGVFDGKNHVINNLEIIGGSHLGLFGRLDDGAEVKNLGLVAINITGSGNFVGGLVGYNNGSAVNRCYSTGMVNGDKDVGGLVGLNDRGSIDVSYSSVTVSGGEYVGGLVGSNGGYVTSCYSVGAVDGTGSDVGGLVGINTATFVRNPRPGIVPNCFWGTQTSGQATSAAGTGLTTAQMQDAQTFLDAGWDWICEIKNGTHEVWQMPGGGGYPALAIFGGYTPPQLQGLGTLEDPYLISDALELGAIVYYSPHAHYRLVAPIDLSGIRWGKPVIGLFRGTFDGNGHTIFNFTYDCNGVDHIGLFAYVDGENAQIKDLELIDPNINAGMGTCVGSLVGRLSEGTVTNCSVKGGTVSGNRNVGGLVGENYEGEITNCYVTGNVAGESTVGGLVGCNDDGDVSDCYSSSEVSGSQNVGGLVGVNWYGAVTLCYSTGTVTGYWSVGGLLGYNSAGGVTDCYSTGAVSGTDSVGGLVGHNLWETGASASLGGPEPELRHMLTNCYSTGSVSGDFRVGGLVGENNINGTINGCYSIGSVSGNEDVGGLVGKNWGRSVSDCYSTGAVSGTDSVGGLVGADNGTVRNSLWDIETSGRSNMCGRQKWEIGDCNNTNGKTTAEMQTESTFLNAGWDFVAESVNGTEDIWSICEGVDYPRLTWQFVIGDFDGDAKVGFVDFAIFAEYWLGTDSSFWCAGGGTDLTSDGKIRFDDLREFAENWLQPQPQEPPPPPPPPPKGGGCFLADTPVWVNGALVQISDVVPGQMVGGLHCEAATDCLEQIETVEEHEGTFECRDIVLESGNRISVVDAHCFMLESGQWIAVQELRSGLRLKTLNGTVGIKSVATRAAPFVGKVYNLNIKGANQYFVGKDRVIVRDY